MLSKKSKNFQELILNSRAHKECNLPFVLYQKPNEKLVKGIFSLNSSINYTSSFSEEGFVFSPFDDDKAILLTSDETSEVPYERKETRQRTTIIPFEENKTEHLQLVNKAIATIKKGALKKVVVSRKIEVETKKNEFVLFQDLLDTYPNALKYLWFHPKVGMWIGATPETLLKIEKESFNTTSLAGTLPVVEGESPVWTKKEIEEQQLVTDYILAKVSKKLIDVKTTPATTIKAGKLWHLKSTITGALKKEIGLDEIIKTIHPTPAICGVPKEASKKFLLTNEGYDREFYTGFLGEINFDSVSQIHLFVNLRCMKLMNKKATIFIGGGITKESDAEKEWNETQHKSKTMLNLL